MSNKPASIDEYLANVDEEKRAALQQLREQLHELLPNASEAISYQVPTIKVNGKGLVAFSAAKKHCSLHVMSPRVAAQVAEKLDGFSKTKASIHFTREQPIPLDVLREIVAARLQENQ